MRLSVYEGPLLVRPSRTAVGAFKPMEGFLLYSSEWVCDAGAVALLACLTVGRNGCLVEAGRMGIKEAAGLSLNAGLGIAEQDGPDDDEDDDGPGMFVLIWVLVLAPPLVDPDRVFRGEIMVVIVRQALVARCCRVETVSSRDGAGYQVKWCVKGSEWRMRKVSSLCGGKRCCCLHPRRRAKHASRRVLLSPDASSQVQPRD